MTTLNEKYLYKVLPYLNGADGGSCKTKTFSNGLQGYEFPCPFCSVNQSKLTKKKKGVAYLLPHKESFSWTFYCHRKQSSECNCGGKNFPQFLAMINQSLFQQYLKEKSPEVYYEQFNSKNPTRGEFF